MTNLQIKKEILKAIKYVDEYKIELGLFIGDGCGYADESEMPIYNDLIVYDENNEEIFQTYYGSDNMQNNEVDLKVIRAEQKKMETYLNKNFNNIKVYETEV